MREIGVAVFKARLICHSEFNDQDIDDDLLITDAWLRDAEGWRAVTRHASPVPKWKFVALQTQQLTRFAQVSRDTSLNTKSSNGASFCRRMWFPSKLLCRLFTALLLDSV